MPAYPRGITRAPIAAVRVHGEVGVSPGIPSLVDAVTGLLLIQWATHRRYVRIVQDCAARRAYSGWISLPQ